MLKFQFFLESMVIGVVNLLDVLGDVGKDFGKDFGIWVLVTVLLLMCSFPLE